MKAISIPEIVSRLRTRRSGKTFISNFINECTIEDVVPLEKVKQAKDEIHNLDEIEYAKYSDAESRVSNVNELVEAVLNIMDKLIEESEGENES